MPRNYAEPVHISMGPRLPFVLLKYISHEGAICILARIDSRQPDSEAALLLERVQAIQGIRMVLGNEFKPILERHNDRGIHPWIRCPSQCIYEFLV